MGFVTGYLPDLALVRPTVRCWVTLLVMLLTVVEPGGYCLSLLQHPHASFDRDSSDSSWFFIAAGVCQPCSKDGSHPSGQSRAHATRLLALHLDKLRTRGAHTRRVCART